MMPKPIVIVSYADTSKGHHGYIYQATNFIYTGLSAKRTDWHVDGINLHGSSIADKSRGQENRAKWMRNKYGDKFKLVDRPRKHRYFMFLGNKNQRDRMLSILPYSIEPYPKGTNNRYDSSFKPSTQLTIL